MTGAKDSSLGLVANSFSGCVSTIDLKSSAPVPAEDSEFPVLDGKVTSASTTTLPDLMRRMRTTS